MDFHSWDSGGFHPGVHKTCAVFVLTHQTFGIWDKHLCDYEHCSLTKKLVCKYLPLVIGAQKFLCRGLLDVDAVFEGPNQRSFPKNVPGIFLGNP